MPTVLKTVLLLALAMIVAAMTFQTIRSGVVKWRSGTVAMTRAESPVAFWAVVALQLLACAFIVSEVL